MKPCVTTVGWVVRLEDAPYTYSTVTLLARFLGAGRFRRPTVDIDLSGSNKLGLLYPLLQVELRCLQQLFVLYVPDILICPVSDIGNQLTESPCRIPLTQLTEDFEEGSARWIVHGSASFTF